MKLLNICNYSIAYKKEWDSFISFIEKGEKDYPFASLFSAPDVINLIGEYKKSDIALLANMKEENESYLFSLEAALNKIKILTNNNKNGEELILTLTS